MKVLVVKTSSLGDVLHTLPAITDLATAHPSVEIDWVVEPMFAEIPTLHNSVNTVIIFPFRKWRKNLFKYKNEILDFISSLRAKKYDIVIDAQCLLKSAVVTSIASGKKFGLAWQSAREPLASLAYQKKIQIKKGTHAVKRVRNLFASVFNYNIDHSTIDYGVNKANLKYFAYSKPYVVLLHGTTWESKHYPEQLFKAVITSFESEGLDVLLPWASNIEHERAKRLQNDISHAHVLPKMLLTELSGVLVSASACIAVDTGLGHMAAALDVPTVSLYGPTNPDLTGTYGNFQIHLKSEFGCAPCLKRKCIFPNNTTIFPPCFNDITPENIVNAVKKLLEKKG